MPFPWSANDILTAADLNALRTDVFLQPSGGLGAWTSWTPAIVQSGSVTSNPTAAYMKIGRLVIAYFICTVTGTGTAANNVTVSLPVTAALASTSTIIGVGRILDSSAADTFTGICRIQTTTTLSILSTRANGVLGTVSFTAALANPDSVSGLIAYEAAA